MKNVLVAVVKNIKNVVNNKMKIWIHDTQTSTHRLIKLNCEQHSNFTYAGEFDDTTLKTFFLELDPNMDIDKNIKLITYYGYLHLFIIKPSQT